MPMPIPMPRITRESPHALNDDTSDSLVIQESPRESLFKDRYFVSGRGIGAVAAASLNDLNIQLRLTNEKKCLKKNKPKC